MKARNRLRRVLMTAAVMTVLASAGAGAVTVLDSIADPSGPDAPGPSRADATDVVSQRNLTSTDAGANPWAANDCVVLRAALREGAPWPC
jgi:hypothetical protein